MRHEWYNSGAANAANVVPCRRKLILSTNAVQPWSWLGTFTAVEKLQHVTTGVLLALLHTTSATPYLLCSNDKRA